LMVEVVMREKRQLNILEDVKDSPVTGLCILKIHHSQLAKRDLSHLEL